MIHLNGESYEFRNEASLADLLLELKLDPMRIAVEVNQQLVPRREHQQYALNEGDKVEIVTLVGGG